MELEIHGVLTGDLIGSSRLDGPVLSAARDAIERYATCLGHLRDDGTLLKADFFRGDSWQIFLKRPNDALRVAIYVRSLLLGTVGVDTRVSIGIGPVASIDRRNVSMSTGEAFSLSGRALDGMGRSVRLTGALPPTAGVFASWFPVALRLCDGLASGWTRRQAQLVSFAVSHSGATYEEIGAMADPAVSQQSVTNTLGAARWRPVSEFLTVFEETDWQRDVMRSPQGMPT